MSKSHNNFYLTKWYLDCIDEQGNAAIGYAASMRWRSLEVPYTSLLLFEEGKGASERSRFQELNWPSQMGGRQCRCEESQKETANDLVLNNLHTHINAPPCV